LANITAFAGDLGELAQQTQHMPPAPKRIAIVASLSFSLVNFRFQLIKAMVDEGHEVIAFAPEHDPEVLDKLHHIGVRFIRIPMARTGLNPLADLRTLLSLCHHFYRLKPDVVLPYTMKPIVYGCLAARITGIKHRFALFTGLGHVFSGKTPTARMLLVRQISVWLYRTALVGAERVFVYNEADAQDIMSHRMLLDNSIIKPVPGSGVDLAQFGFAEAPEGEFKFLLIARLLKDKGIFEYANAARYLRKKYPNVHFQLLGPFEPHASSVNRNQIDDWESEGILEYLGQTRDVRPFLSSCNVFVLPTCYREGIPRSILEAMATGRAIITTDTPGCRETVVKNENGILVPPRDHEKLAEAMEYFIAKPALSKAMGERSRQLARERFDVHIINQLLLENMGLVRMPPRQMDV
jgi:glycosyltransferase involved in cell wall biosynthesis